MMKKYRVIRDTREQENSGWFFDENELCAGTISGKMDTGDYTIEGFEDSLCIERKTSTGELIHNFCEARFEPCMKRLSKFKYAFLVLEFEWADVLRFPNFSGVPKHKWPYLKVTSRFLVKKIFELQIKYPNIRVCFVGSNGKEFVENVFKYVNFNGI